MLGVPDALTPAPSRPSFPAGLRPTNIVILVKHVTDTQAERRLSPADSTIGRAGASVIKYLDEFAVEEGLRLKEQKGGEVTVLCVGPASLCVGPASAWPRQRSR